MKLTLKQINRDVIPFLITYFSMHRSPNKIRAIILSLFYMPISKSEFLKLKRKDINLKMCSIRIVSGDRRTVYFNKRLVPHLIDYFKSENPEPNKNFCLTTIEDLEFFYQKVSEYMKKKITVKSFQRRKR